MSHPSRPSLSQDPKVTIVTPVFNRIQHTLDFLAACQKQSYKNLEVVIVDDGSTDGTEAKIKAAFPDVIVLRGNGSLWWSGATNKGIEWALEHQADFIFTVNNDVTLDPQVIKASVACARVHPQALIGSKIYYIHEPEKVWFFGARFNRQTADIELIDGPDSAFSTVTEVEMLTGMGMLIPRAVFAEVGWFDRKRLPQYLADSDLSLRAKKAGYKLYVTPESKIYNDTSSSWTIAQIEKGRLGFAAELFFSIKSPYKFSVRYTFYKRHWGDGYIGGVIKFYQLLIKNFIWPFVKDNIKLKIKRLIRRK